MTTDASGDAVPPFLPGGQFLPRPPELDPVGLADRRAAVRELGSALREVVEACVSSEVGTAQLREATRLAQDLGRLLAAERRPLTIPASVDDLPGSVRMFNPVSGVGHPSAPPVQVEVTADGSVVGTTVLGHAFEGPFTYVHGGVSAMLLDQMVGTAVAATGRPGMTAQLDLTYSGPVPLQVPLVLNARVTGDERRKTFVTATIARADEPDRILVRAQGLMISLSDDQAARIFGPG